MQLDPKETRPASNAIAVIEIFEWGCLAPLAVLVLSCLYHYSLIEDPEQYRHSWCIGIELLAMAIAIGCVPFHVCCAIYFCLLKRFRKALVSLLLGGLTFAVIGWVMWYDAPTLVYIT